MLSRIRATFKTQPEDTDIKYLQFIHPVIYYKRDNCEENDDDNGDDISSISSISTNATMDNIPGTGRIIDTFVYQFFGRKLERAVFRMSMRNMSPDRILQYLWVDGVVAYSFLRLPMSTVIQYIGESEKISGLKSLVKQSQSNSLYRSATALLSLVHLSLVSDRYGYFYAAAAAVEPIFHLELLTSALDNSHPEKKYFLFLIGIARARLHYLRIKIPPEKPDEYAINCRRRLLEILDSSRYNPLVVVADACLLFANVSSSIFGLKIHRNSLAPAVHSVTETAYFLLTFLVRFLIDQDQTIHNLHPLQKLILSTFSRWLESVIPFIISCMEWRWDLQQLQPICAFSILRHINSNMQFGVSSPRWLPRRLLSMDVFPRRIRNSTPQEDNPIILQNSLSICAIRIRRLLVSPDELRREAGDLMDLKYGSPSVGFDDPPSEKKSKQELQHSLDRARSVPVVENDLTREFLEARHVIHRDPTCDWDWKDYKTRQRKRHGIGEYCRSNLDWDWDPSSSLNRLFRIDIPKRSSQSDGALQQEAMRAPATNRRGINGGILNMSIPEKGSNLFEKIRVQYETETGEVKYKTYYAGPSVEDTTSGIDSDPGPRLAQESYSLTRESIETGGEVPEAGFRDEMKNTEVADEVHEEERWFWKLNGASDTEDGNALVDSTYRPQYDSRIDEACTMI